MTIQYLPAPPIRCFYSLTLCALQIVFYDYDYDYDLHNLFSAQFAFHGQITFGYLT